MGARLASARMRAPTAERRSDPRLGVALRVGLALIATGIASAGLGRRALSGSGADVALALAFGALRGRALPRDAAAATARGAVDRSRAGRRGLPRGRGRARGHAARHGGLSRRRGARDLAHAVASARVHRRGVRALDAGARSVRVARCHGAARARARRGDVRARVHGRGARRPIARPPVGPPATLRLRDRRHRGDGRALRSSSRRRLVASRSRRSARDRRRIRAAAARARARAARLPPRCDRDGSRPHHLRDGRSRGDHRHAVPHRRGRGGPSRRRAPAVGPEPVQRLRSARGARAPAISIRCSRRISRTGRCTRRTATRRCRSSSSRRSSHSGSATSAGYSLERSSSSRSSRSRGFDWPGDRWPSRRSSATRSCSVSRSSRASIRRGRCSSSRRGSRSAEAGFRRSSSDSRSPRARRRGSSRRSTSRWSGSARVRAKRCGARSIAAAVALAVNLPFLVTAPGPFIGSVLAPLLGPLEPDGVGLVRFGMDGIGPMFPRAVYGALALVAFAALLGAFVRWRRSAHERAAGVAVPAPVLRLALAAELLRTGDALRAHRRRGARAGSTTTRNALEAIPATVPIPASAPRTPKSGRWMRRFFPRDVLLVARLFAVAGALVWILIGGQATLWLAYVALAFLLATSALVWRDDVRRGGVATPLSETPALVVIGDLCAASVWMVASAPNERSVAFVVVDRDRRSRDVPPWKARCHGDRGGVPRRSRPPGDRSRQPRHSHAGAADLRRDHGRDPGAHHPERDRRALPRQSGNRVRAPCGSRAAFSASRPTSGRRPTPEALFRSIARNALLLVDAHHATINRRRGDEFEIVAGAGTGERAVGVRASARLGIVGAVIRSRRAVAWDDYATEVTAVPAIKDIGVRSIVGRADRGAR